MRKILISLLLLAACAAVPAQEIEVPFATGEYEPFTSKRLPNYGLFTEIVSAVCKAAGLKPIYQFYPWTRAERMVLEGKVFGAFPYARTDERARLYDFSDPLYHVTMAIFYYDKNPKFGGKPIQYDRIEDLKGYAFGGLKAIFYEKELLSAGIDFRPQENVDQSFEMMKLGRIDFVIDEISVGYANIKKRIPGDLAHFKTLDKPYGDTKISGLIVSRDYPDSTKILKRFNDGIKAIRVSGEYDRILQRARGNETQGVLKSVPRHAER